MGAGENLRVAQAADQDPDQGTKKYLDIVIRGTSTCESLSQVKKNLEGFKIKIMRMES